MQLKSNTVLLGFLFALLFMTGNTAGQDRSIRRYANFSPAYSKLMKRFSDHQRKDIRRTNRLIDKLEMADDEIYYRLMRVRLVWEFRQPLAPFDSAKIRSMLRTAADSANYYYTLAIGFKYQMDSAVARKMGYVKAVNSNTEIVDWRKLRSMNWNSPSKIIESLGGPDLTYPPDPFSDNYKFRDTAIEYFQIAIELSPSQFYYMDQFVSFLSRYALDTILQETIHDRIKNYTRKEQEKLRQALADSQLRQKQWKDAGQTPLWIESKTSN